MLILYSLPIFFSSLLIAAHFYRGGSVLLAVFCLFVPAILFLRQFWVPRIVSLLLIVFSIEWIRTTLLFVEQYKMYEKPYGRLVTIMGAVIVFTWLSAGVFRIGAMKKRFRRNEDFLIIRR